MRPVTADQRGWPAIACTLASAYKNLQCLPAVRGWVTWTFAAYNLIRLGGLGEWRDLSPT